MSIISTLRNDFGRILTNNYNPENAIKGSKVDEVKMDTIIESNPYLSISGSKISPLEGFEPVTKGTLLNGIPVEIDSVKDVLGQDNFGGVDGSEATLPKSSVALTVSRVAFGSDPSYGSMKIYDVLDDGRRFIFSDKAAIHPSANISKGPLSEAVNLSSEAGYLESLNGARAEFTAAFETVNIKKIAKEYSGTLDMLMIDGLLYRPTAMEYCEETMQFIAEETEIIPVAITKRINERSFFRFVRDALKDDFSLAFQNDNAFMSSQLEPNERSIFFNHIGVNESNLPRHLQRISTYLKLPNHRVIRVELLKQFEDMADDIVKMVLAQSYRIRGDLPLPIIRAHNTSKISNSEKFKINAEFVKMLRRGNIPFKDMQNMELLI